MTRKQFISIFTILLSMTFISSANSQETANSDGEVRYISDDLFTFLHAGPGRNYRILGQVVAGTRVTLLQEDKENDFIEVIDAHTHTHTSLGMGRACNSREALI